MGGVRSLTENSVNFFFFFLNPSLSLVKVIQEIRIYHLHVRSMSISHLLFKPEFLHGLYGGEVDLP